MSLRYLVNEHSGNDELGINAGDIMEEYTSYDYGMRKDHETITGEPHVNLSYDGELPFYTVPLSALSVYSS